VCRKCGKAVRSDLTTSDRLEDSLEKFAALMLEKGGRNVMAVDVSWTPDSPQDILTREELREKWPELIDLL
jgi:uncharacterized membrane protein